MKNVLNLKFKPSSFDAAFCMGNSFGYFNINGMRKFVGILSTALKPGSRLIINSAMLAESILTNFHKNRSFNIGNIRMEIENEYYVNESYMQSRITYTKNNKSEIHSFKHYVFTLSEIRRLLSEFHLETISVYGNLEKATYKLGDPQIFIVAEKLKGKKPNGKKQ